MALLSDVMALPPDELLQLKNRIITDRDKKRYTKEILSNLSLSDAELTIQWIKKKYGIT